MRPALQNDMARTEDSWPAPDPLGVRPEAWIVPPDPDCSIGSRLFDPRHGVVIVESLESRERNGRMTEYLTLHVVGQQMVLLVPRATMGAGALRRVITASEASAVLEELAREPVAMVQWTSLGFAEVQRRMLGRNPLAVARVVRDLAAKGGGKSLGITEKTLFVRGAELLAVELGVALGVTTERARGLMEDAMAVGRLLSG